MNTPNLREAALALARLGWRVFPLKPGQKEPLIAAWQHHATNDIAIVERWWIETPHANIGIHCGNGVLGFDVDTKKGKSGPASLAALEAPHGTLPDTLTVRTPSGGHHRYFAGPNVTNSAGKLGDGLDIRSEGGFLVAPPSRTAQGVYEWATPAQSIAPAPQWFLDRLQTQRVAVEREIETDITPAQLADLESALMHPALLQSAGGNEEWSNIGLALLSLGDIGRELWIKFSDEAANPNPGAWTGETWWGKHCRTRPRSDFRSIFKRAAALGWKNPNPIPMPDPRTVGFGLSPAPEGMSLTPIKESPAAPAPPATAGAPAIAFTHIADVLARKSTVQWLPGLRDILEVAVLAMLVAPRDTLKSFIAIEWGMRAAVAGCGVVFLSGEGAGFDRRIDAWLRRHGNGIDPKALRVVALERPVDLNHADTLKLVSDAVRALGWTVQLVVVDTLSKFTPNVKENDGTENAQLFAKLSDTLRYQIGATVLMVGHTGHSEPGRPRGSSVRMANPDAEYVAERFDTFRVSVTRERFKDSPSLDPLSYEAEVIDLQREDEAGVRVTSLALTPSTVTVAEVKADAKRNEGRKPKGANEEAAFAAVVELMGQNPVGQIALVAAIDKAVSLIPEPPPDEEDRRRDKVRAAYKTLLKRKALRGVEGAWVSLPIDPKVVFAEGSISTNGDGGERPVPSVEEQRARHARLNPVGVTLPPVRDH